MGERIRIIDTHAHVLFGLDDGSRSVEESVSLIKEEIKQGVTGIIATPHYSRRSQSTEVRAIQEGLIAEIRERLDMPGFKIYTGQETVWHEDLPDRLMAGKGLTLAGSRYVLIEYDESVVFDLIRRSIRTLEICGYVPILAHAERYACLREEGRIDEVLSLQAKIQMNYDSLSGGIFDRNVRWCRRMVTERKVHILGTDMHRIDWRKPEITAHMNWMQKNLSVKEIERMTYFNPLHIINNENLG